MARLRRPAWLAALALAAALAPAAGPPAPAAAAERVIQSARVLAPDHLLLRLERPLADLRPDNFRLTENLAPDVAIEITGVAARPGAQVLLTAAQTLDPAGSYRVEIGTPRAAREVRPPPWVLLLSVVLSAAFINNFVFTRYLGLCVFFGVSKRRDTAIGMGITFTAVMVASAMLSWVLYTYVLSPLNLRFLQVLVFIGIVAFLVQLLDTVLKKTHRALHQKFGIYLMLITTNCIILAVPLLNASANAGPADALALAVGSGVGFALALFLMSCARERVELARVPRSFEGLPIAFILTGLFALAFMGFSGLNPFR
jgi:electron transport complex protein RnfA